MACTDCQAAKATSGLWRTYNPACLWCGGRLLRQLGSIKRPTAEITERRRKVLADWMALGHDEQKLRDLAKQPMPLEP